MATLYVQWHKTLPRAARGGATPIVEEPAISTETVATSGTAANTGTKPDGADIAICFCATDVAFKVNESGGSTAATVNDKKISANVEREIHVPDGGHISVIDA